MSLSLEQIISPTRPWIKYGDIVRLQDYYKELQADDQAQDQLPRIDWAELFKRLFINACVEGQLGIAQWLYEEYQKLPLLAQLALRPTFHYSRFMARKKLQEYQRRKPSNRSIVSRYQQLIQWLTLIKDAKPTLQ